MSSEDETPLYVLAMSAMTALEWTALCSSFVLKMTPNVLHRMKVAVFAWAVVLAFRDTWKACKWLLLQLAGNVRDNTVTQTGNNSPTRQTSGANGPHPGSSPSPRALANPDETKNDTKNDTKSPAKVDTDDKKPEPEISVEEMFVEVDTQSVMSKAIEGLHEGAKAVAKVGKESVAKIGGLLSAPVVGERGETDLIDTRFKANRLPAKKIAQGISLKNVNAKVDTNLPAARELKKKDPSLH